MNRRSFLTSILAAGMAPAVVRAESLMRCFVRRESGLLVADYYVGSLTLTDLLLAKPHEMLQLTEELIRVSSVELRPDGWFIGGVRATASHPQSAS